MFCFNTKFKELSPIQHYVPTNPIELLVLKAVQSPPSFCGMHSALGILQYVSGEWVFEVLDAKSSGVRVWHVPKGEYILGGGNTLLVGTITDDCFSFLLSPKETTKSHEERLEELFKKYSIL